MNVHTAVVVVMSDFAVTWIMTVSAYDRKEAVHVAEAVVASLKAFRIKLLQQMAILLHHRARVSRLFFPLKT